MFICIDVCYSITQNLLNELESNSAHKEMMTWNITEDTFYPEKNCDHLAGFAKNL